MFLLSSRFFILYLLLLSSVVLAKPVSWNMDPDFPDIIHIRNEHGKLIQMQMLSGDPWGYKFIEIEGQAYCLPMIDIDKGSAPVHGQDPYCSLDEDQSQDLSLSLEITPEMENRLMEILGREGFAEEDCSGIDAHLEISHKKPEVCVSVGQEPIKEKKELRWTSYAEQDYVKKLGKFKNSNKRCQPNPEEGMIGRFRATESISKPIKKARKATRRHEQNKRLSSLRSSLHSKILQGSQDKSSQYGEEGRSGHFIVRNWRL